VIIWLASYPRSGNTLLRLILHECFGLKTWSIYDDIADVGSRTEFSQIVGHNKHGLDQESFTKKASDSSDVYFVKTHDRPRDDQKSIYIVRDGRSAIVSYFHYRMDNDIDPRPKPSLEDVVAGNDMFGSWSDHFKAWAPNRRPNTLFLRFDEVVRDPSNAIKKIAAFAELPVLKLNTLPFTALQRVDSKFFRSGSDTKNIAELQGKALDLFWVLHGELMVELGYVDSVPPIRDISGIGSPVWGQISTAERR